MFKATKPSNELFESWIKDSERFQALDAPTKSLVRKAFAHGWNSAVHSFLPANSQAETAFSLNQEVNQVLGELARESDRSVAVVGCAFVDEALVTAISSAIVDSEKARETVEKRFQTYSSRVNLAYCLGFFSEDSLSDFAALGWVRNQFAHRRNMKSFSDQEIENRCRNLRTLKAIEGWNETNPRQCFITAIAVISVMLTHRARMEPQRLSWGNVWEAE